MNSSAPDYRKIPNTKIADLRHIPGHDGWPIVGRTFEMVNDFVKQIEGDYQKYGRCFRMNHGVIMCGVVALGPENYQQLFLDPEKNFSTEMSYKESIGYFYEGGLLLRDFDEHRFQRRVFQTAFKNEAMRGYADLMNPIMDRGLKEWGNDPNFLFFPHIKQMLLDVAAKVFFGIDDLGEDAQKLNKAFLDIAEEGLMAIFKKAWLRGKFYKGVKAKEYVADFIQELIPVRRNDLEGKDFMSFVTKEKKENGEYFSDWDLIQHLSFLLFAAHDTTTSALSHLCMLLAQHPEWQEKLREEVMSIDGEFLQYDDIDKLPNLHNAFMEGLRLYPSVSMMTRRNIRPFELEGYEIPANTIIFIPPFFNHRMEEWWDDPLKFDPDRFAEHRQEHKRHSFSFIPFGGGAHKCIGMHFAMMNAKCFMFQFLKKYRFSATTENYKPKMQIMPMPRPDDMLPLNLQRL